MTPTKRPHTVCSNSSSSGRKGRSGSIENLLPKASLLDLCPNSITIIHKSYVKVFYGTKQDADADKYFDYCGGPIPVNKLTGQLHPFGGIRGDAKALWKQIRFGMEPRVRLQQIKYNVAVIGRNEIPSVKPAAGGASAAIKQTIVDKLFDDAAVIVWACGYNSNLVPIFDVDGKTIPVRQYRGQVDVDEEGQLHTEDDFKLYSTKVDCPDRSQKQDRVPEVQKVGTDDKQVQTPTKPLIQRDIASSQLLVGLYGSGLGYGPRIYLENGQPDGSSGL